MEPKTDSNDEQAKELLDALTHIWNHVFAFHNSMALKSAIQLGIADAIHKHGKPMTLDELANSLSILPSKASSLHHLMRLLVHSKFFSTINLGNNGEAAFDLTFNSQLLLKNHPLTLAPFALLGTDPILTEPSHQFGLWFQNRDESYESPFHITEGKHFYECMPSESKFNEFFNQAMSSDSRLISSLLLASDEFKGIIKGVESLIDVGGGNGTTAKAIAEAYPKLKCMVFDLPHVVNGSQGNGMNLTYVAGDMFDAIPQAHVVILKCILHNWSDDKCIEILKRCKEAIPSRDEGGKLLIIEMVVGVPTDNLNHTHSQCLSSMQMLTLVGGKERTEEQWKYLFNNAGFNDYKILPILGSRSVIEVYPN